MWAKHDRDGEGWLPLWRHMEDSAAAAALLWDRWLPSNVQPLIAEALPQGLSDARSLVVWLAAVHDIGKATPAFACQVESLSDRMRDEGLEMKPAEISRRISAGRSVCRGSALGSRPLRRRRPGEHGQLRVPRAPRLGSRMPPASGR